MLTRRGLLNLLPKAAIAGAGAAAVAAKPAPGGELVRRKIRYDPGNKTPMTVEEALSTVRELLPTICERGMSEWEREWSRVEVDAMAAPFRSQHPIEQLPPVFQSLAIDITILVSYHGEKVAMSGITIPVEFRLVKLYRSNTGRLCEVLTALVRDAVARYWPYRHMRVGWVQDGTTFKYQPLYWVEHLDKA